VPLSFNAVPAIVPGSVLVRHDREGRWSYPAARPLRVDDVLRGAKSTIRQHGAGEHLEPEATAVIDGGTIWDHNRPNTG
jgi:hypothetical protein